MILGDDVAKRSDAVETVKHEYGHTTQFDRMGPVNYALKVALPSVTCNLLDRADLLPYGYYSSPWEYEADMKGGVKRGNYDSWASTVNIFYSILTRIGIRC